VSARFNRGNQAASEECIHEGGLPDACVAIYPASVLASGSLNEKTAPRWWFSAQMSPP
jgi:hypothetical protein